MSFPQSFAILACVMSVFSAAFDIWGISLGGRVPDYPWLHALDLVYIGFVLICVLAIVLFVRRGISLFSPVVYLVYFTLEFCVYLCLAIFGIVDVDTESMLYMPPAMMAADLAFCIFYLVVNIKLLGKFKKVAC